MGLGRGIEQGVDAVGATWKKQSKEINARRTSPGSPPSPSREREIGDVIADAIEKGQGRLNVEEGQTFGPSRVHWRACS
jgi:hypothetical protein